MTRGLVRWDLATPERNARHDMTLRGEPPNPQPPRTEASLQWTGARVVRALAGASKSEGRGTQGDVRRWQRPGAGSRLVASPPGPDTRNVGHHNPSSGPALAVRRVPGGHRSTKGQRDDGDEGGGTRRGASAIDAHRSGGGHAAPRPRAGSAMRPQRARGRKPHRPGPLPPATTTAAPRTNAPFGLGAPLAPPWRPLGVLARPWRSGPHTTRKSRGAPWRPVASWR